MKNIMSDILMLCVTILVPKFNLSHKTGLNLGRMSKSRKISIKVWVVLRLFTENLHHLKITGTLFEVTISTFSGKFSFNFYRPQTKFAEVTFLHVSLCPQWGGGGVACVAGGVCMAAGHAWQGVCMAGGGHLCMAGGLCVAGGVHGSRGMCGVGTCVPSGRYYKIRSMSGRYASY